MLAMHDLNRCDARSRQQAFKLIGPNTGTIVRHACLCTSGSSATCLEDSTTRRRQRLHGGRARLRATNFVATDVRCDAPDEPA